MDLLIKISAFLLNVTEPCQCYYLSRMVDISKSIWDTTRVVIGGFEHPSASVLCGIADCGALVLRPTVGSMRLLASRVLECAEGDAALCRGSLGTRVLDAAELSALACWITDGMLHRTDSYKG